MKTTRFTTLTGLAVSAMLVGAVAGVGIRPVDATLHAFWTRPPAATVAEEKEAGEASRERGGEQHAEGEVHLTAEQIEAAGIQLVEVSGGTIARHVTVPGTVTASADRLARVPARVAGTVTELRRRLGDTVASGDVLAVVESREIAEAKAGYLAALRTEALARTTADRERRLWERKISAEQDFLKARTDAEEARIQLDLSRARLSALGLGAQEITALPGQPTEALRRQEVRATLAGRVTDRRIDVGASVTPETEAFVVADLSVVWVEMTISASDLAFLQEGQTVLVTGAGVEQPREGRIIFVSPVLDTQTRTARAVAELPNADTAWRPGAFVAAAIAAEEQPVERRVPLESLQTVEAETVVFVRTEEGFEKRKVTLGRRDERVAEVLSGLEPGEQVAAAGSFILKAELGKSDAEHED
ncbi:efflux RND transporter periplasmic adaptor subunit [Roseicella sp. DB1501]|uniref:efflux RND transporter periplasmic adaptor subunit n=1 Tax=Roseicella sp. DB1501 TaxID=2730925 RepID=UPI0014909814|nr:efflux RND transporter periplasmic adaptor subunit [Roseicella sp. DB1501]NOG73552.1 efflux RND transporter periplasmic adaptor subunit [Roseicella sp. DB1501]